MTIRDALTGIQGLCLDTAPLLYYVEDNPISVARRDAMMKAIEDKPIAVVSSVIALTEVLTHPLKLSDARIARIDYISLKKR